MLKLLSRPNRSHSMKVHRGYLGDNWVRQTDLPNFRPSFGIYQVEITRGGEARNIRRYAGLAGHYPAAGNPTRGEIDSDQEINYRAAIRAIEETGCHGMIDQEFKPQAKERLLAVEDAFGCVMFDHPRIRDWPDS